MIRILTCSLLALGVALSAVPAFAQADVVRRSVDVGHADIDLTTQVGRETLDERIDAAAQRVCPRSTAHRDLAMWVARRDCIAAARAGADEQLSAIYAGRTLAEGAVRVSAPRG
jgi:UrcA family protein